MLHLIIKTGMIAIGMKYAHVSDERSKINELLGALLSARYSQGFFLVIVEVACIAGAFAFGQKGRFDLLNRAKRDER